MKFNQTIFGNQCSSFINNALYAKTKFDKVKSSLIDLEDILISGELSFPKLTSTFLDVADISDLSYFTVYKTLAWKEQGNPKASGFDRFKINDMHFEGVDIYLQDLPSEYQGLALQLQTIYKYINKNIDHYSKFLYLINDIDSILNRQLDIQVFDYYTNLFRFIYNKQPLELLGTSHTNSQYVSIPTIMQLYIFHYLYYIGNNSVNLTMNELYMDANNPILGKNYIASCYTDYFTNHTFDFSNKLKNYIINNILSFGINVSQDISTLLQKTIANNITAELLPVINTLGYKVMPSDYLYRIVDTAFHNMCYSSLIKRLPYSDSFVWNLDKYTNYNQDVQDKIYQYEDVILRNLNNYMSKNVSDISMLVNIPVKFTSNPVFFINAHLLVFAHYSLNYIQSKEVFNYSDVDYWLQNILDINTLHMNNLLQYFNNNPVEYDDESFNFAAILVMKTSIENLIKHDNFIKYITTSLIPAIDSIIKTQYKINITWNEHVESIIYIIKTILLNEFITALADNTSTKLFYEPINILKTEFINKLTTTPVKLTKEDVLGVYKYESSDNKKWYYLFNSFFKSSYVSSVLQTYLQKTYSLN